MPEYYDQITMLRNEEEKKFSNKDTIASSKEGGKVIDAAKINDDDILKAFVQFLTEL